MIMDQTTPIKISSFFFPELDNLIPKLKWEWKEAKIARHSWSGGKQSERFALWKIKT